MSTAGVDGTAFALGAAMRLDLVIATYRRPALLAGTLDSICAARRPAGLQLRVLIVNNDPASDLSELATQIAAAPIPVVTLEQALPGKSSALNLGIVHSTADYVGIIDDDEQLAPSWLEVAYEALRAGDLDFIGGPMLPIWPSRPPAWIPDSYKAVLGIVESGTARAPYSTAFQGMLVGGNAVIRRSLFEQVGLYATDLGPRASHRLLSCEDEDMYVRLLEHGARGEYIPSLVVFHHVHAERICRRYYRAWCFWNAASKALMRRRRAAVVAVAGIPRYVFGRAARGAAAWVSALVRADPGGRLEAELPVWQLAGYLYGRFRLRRLQDGPGPAA